MNPPVDPMPLLLKEYDALYGLVLFRMASLDRRAPIAGATLAASLATLSVLPEEIRTLFLLGLPAALVWFFRTTTNHARSFEDVLARLAEIEVAINTATGAEVLVFQSRHPSRNQAVGGRTGRETVGAAFGTCVLLLLAAVYLNHSYHSAGRWAYAYDLYAALTLGLLVQTGIALRGYRYVKSAADNYQVETNAQHERSTPCQATRPSTKSASESSARRSGPTRPNRD